MAPAQPIRKKVKGNDQPGDPLPVPIASLTGFPSSATTWNYFNGIYKDGVITVTDPNQVASLWHNGYFGQLKNTNLQSNDCESEDTHKYQKKWKLIETDGLKDASYFRRFADPESEATESSDCEVIDFSDCEMIDIFEGSENKGMKEKTDSNKSDSNNSDSNNSARVQSENDQRQKNIVRGHRAEKEKNVMSDVTKSKSDLNRTYVQKDQKCGDLDLDMTCKTVMSFDSDQNASTFFDSSTVDKCNGYLELLLEEAMFLSYALGCLVVKRNISQKFKGSKRKEQAMTIDQMWREFVSQDPKFVVRYAVYHNYRTKGWVVKSGLKFGGDFVLYPVGPPFYHAQYTVMIQCVWADNNERDDSLSSHGSLSSREMSWTSITATERLNTHVKKTPLICYVLRPRSLTFNRIYNIVCLQSLAFEEMVLSRWDPTAGNNEPEDMITLD